jgi:hypothetical protein
MPEGFGPPTADAKPADIAECVREATLPEARRLLPKDDVRVALRDWWLAVSKNTRTPNWDIASTCTIEDKKGIVLIEAKAHYEELRKEETGKQIKPPVSGNARRNHLRIDWAIRDASAALAEETGLTWALSRDWNYQMSNRFAWAWKLADLGIPIVLVYLGFLRVRDMSDKGKPLGEPFADDLDWRRAVNRHSQALFPAEVWGRRLMCRSVPFIPLIRSREVPLTDLVSRPQSPRTGADAVVEAEMP